MLVAHLVPGFFALLHTEPHWPANWSAGQRRLLWTAALGSTVAPDADVIFNAFFRGFINHSTLWTHSLFVHLSIGGVWWLLYCTKRWPYGQTLVGLLAFGGLSHLVLDVIAHGTPLFYPFSTFMLGYPPARVVAGGLWAYLTDPLFLLEPFAWTLLALYVVQRRCGSPHRRYLLYGALLSGFLLFCVCFLGRLAELRHWLGVQ